MMRSSAPQGDPFWDARTPFYIKKTTAAIWPYSEDGNRVFSHSRLVTEEEKPNQGKNSLTWNTFEFEPGIPRLSSDT